MKQDPSIKKKSTTVSPSGQNQEDVSSGTSTMATKKPSVSSGSVDKNLFRGDAGAGEQTYRLDKSSGVPVWKEYSSTMVDYSGKKAQYDVYDKTITDPTRVKTLNKFFKQNASADENDEVFTGFPGKESNRYRVFNGSWQRMQPNAKEWTTINEDNAVTALNRQYKKDIKPIKGLNVAKEGAKFTDINTKLVSQTEGNVVPYLQKKYSNLGFKFEEAKVGQDYVTVTSKDGNTVEVSLDEANPEEALKLRHFLSQNASAPESKKSIYLKAKREEDPNYAKTPEYINALKSLSPDEVEDLIDERKSALAKDLSDASFVDDYKGVRRAKEGLNNFYNSEEYKIYKEKKSEKLKERSTKVDQLYYEYSNAKTTKDKQYIKTKINTFLSDDIIQKQTDGYNMQLMDVQNAYKKVNSEYTNLNSAAASGKITQEQYDAQLAKLNQKRVDLKENSDGVVSQMKKLEKVTGKYLLDKEKMGSFGGNILNGVAGGLSKIIETPATFGSEAFRKETYEALPPEEKKYLSDKGYTKEQAINYVANKSAKEIKSDIREGFIGAIGTKGTTKEYAQSKDRGFFETALVGVAESLPAMLIPGGSVVRTIAMGSQAYASIEDEMLNDPDFETTSMAERSLIAAPYAVGMGILENLGFTKMISKDPLAKSLVMKSITKVLSKKATAETLESSLEKELKSNIAKFGLKVVGGTLAEAETGALQSAILDIGFKTTYNQIRNLYEGKSAEEISKLTGGGYLETPDNLKEAGKQILEDAAAEALGGTVMTAAMTGFEKLSNGEITLFNDEDITKLKELSSDPEMKKMFVAKLRTDMVEGKITKEEAKTKLEALRSVEADFTRIPDDITGPDLRRAIKLSIEKKDLTKEIEGKDENLVAPKKARIEEINNELKTIGENATKESNKQEVSTEGDIVQREGTDAGQQEIGQGEGAVGETAQPSTDTGDSNISSQEEKVDPLINVEATAKALNNDLAQQIQDESGQLFPLNVDEDPEYFTRLSERYHKAKQNGTQPELVNAFENVLGTKEVVEKTQQPVATAPSQSQEVVPDVFGPTVEQEAERLGKLLTAENVDSILPSFTTNNKNIKQQTSNAVKAISKILPKVQIKVYNTNKEYLEAVGDSSRGTYDHEEKIIHINLEKANNRTVAHEVFHAVLLSRVSSDAEARRLTKAMINSVMKSLVNAPNGGAIISELKKFASSYEKNEMNEEKLSELFGYLADNHASLPVQTKNIIARFLERIAKLFGLKSMTDAEVVEFMNEISRRVETGIEISDSDIKSLGTGKISVGNIQNRKSNFINSLVFERFKTNKNTKVIKNFDIKDIDGQVAGSTLSDKLMAGMLKSYKTVKGQKVLKDVYTFFGGVGYPEVTGRIWASSTKWSATAIVESMVVSKDGYRYLIPAIMSDVSHMSNKNMTYITMELFKEAFSNKELNRTEFKDLVSKAFSNKGTIKYKDDALKSISGNISANDMADKLNNFIASRKMSFAARRDILYTLVGDSTVGNPKFNTVGTFLSLAKSLSEPMVKDATLNQVVTVIRTKGNVRVVETSKEDEFYHSSYDFHVESDQEIEVLHLDGAYNLTDIIPEFKKKDGELVSTEQEIKEKTAKGWNIKNILQNLGRTHGISIYSAPIVAKRKQISPENSSNYANLTEDKDGNFVFFHVGGKGYDVIKRSSGSTLATSKVEASAISKVGGVAMYYTKPMDSETMVNGTNRYAVKVKADEVYDFNTDQDNLIDIAKERFEKDYPGGAFSPNVQMAYITKIAGENGYKITVGQWGNRTRAQSTEELKPVDEQVIEGNRIIKDFNEEYVSNFEKGFVPEIPTSKQELLSDVYNDIYKERRSESRYDNLYRLAENPSKWSQEEITDMVVKSDLSKDVKDKYNDALNYKQGNRISVRKQKNGISKIIKYAKDNGFSDAAIIKHLTNSGYNSTEASEELRRYNAVKDNVFLNDPKTGIPKIAQKIKMWSKDQLTTKGNRPNSMFEAQENMDGVIAEALNKVVRISKDFNKVYNAIPKEQREKFLEDYDAYLRGDKTVDISDDAKIVANEMRNQIDALSINIINAGLAPLGVEEEIRNNLGSYLTRSYEVFKNKDYKAKEEITQRAKNFLQQQYLKEATQLAKENNTDVDFELNRLVNNKIDDLTNRIGADDFVGGGKLGSKSKELGVFKEKTDIPIEIRQLMGEFTDPVQNYAETVVKLSALSAKNDFLNKIKDAGMGVYLFTEKTRPEGYNVQIAAPGSDSMNPLNGLYTTPEIAKEFNNLPGELGKLMKIYMQAISMIKWGKTIGSVMTHAKNLFGNLGFIAVNGHTSGAGDAFKAIYSDISNSSNEEIRKKIDKYIELGIMKQSASIGEIRDMFKDADFDKSLAERLSKRPSIKKKPIASVLGRGKRIAKSIGSAAETAYQAEDDFFKVLAYESELRRYSKAEFNKDVNDLTDAERAKIDETVANIVKDTMPTFSRIPKIVKSLRKSPLLGNFISFQAESYRTAFKTMQLAKSEITSKNPAIRAIGARRVIGTLTYISAKNALLSFYGSAFGMGLSGLTGYFGDDDDEKEKEKDLRKFLPPWSTQSDIIPIKNSDGTIKYIDMSAADPHGGINKAFNAFFGGDNPIDGAKETMFSIFKPFLEPEMTAKAMFNLVSGTDNYDIPIWNSEDDWNGIAGNIAEFAFGIAQPGTVTSALRISNSEDKLKEVIGASTGYRPIKIDVGESFGYRVYDYRDRLDKAKELYSSISRNEKSTDEEKEKALEKANSKTEKIYKELMEDYNSAERLGVDSGKLRTELKDKLNLSDKNLKTILSGGYAEVKPKEAERRRIIFR
jgi:hypothetical protein